MGLLGSFIRFLLGQWCKPTTTGGDYSESLGPHGVSAATVGVSALAQDLYNFEITSQVPEGLAQHVVSSRKAQANWYRKLVVAWREAKPPPRTPEEAARLVIQTLKQHQRPDVEGLLAFYGLPLPHTLVSLSAEVPTSLPQGVKYEFQTLPVDGKAIQDGDSLTVYVSTEDPRESSFVPIDVQRVRVVLQFIRVRITCVVTWRLIPHFPNRSSTFRSFIHPSMSLFGVFGNTIAAAIHLTHQHLHGAIPRLCLLERVLKPPPHAVRHHPGQRNPVLPLGALHPQLHPLRVDQFRLRGRNSNLGHLLCAPGPRELVGSDNSGQILEPGRPR